MRGVNMMLNQLWVGKTTRFWQSLLCALVTCLIINATAWGADVTNKLTAVAVDRDATAPTILIETAQPVGYRYTVYDSVEPTRVVVDFPGMELADVTQQIAVDQGPVKEVRVAGFALASGQLARVEIILAENTEYQVKLDGNQFRIAFAADTAAAQPVATAPAVEEKVVAAEPMASTESLQTASLLSDVKLSAGQAVLEINGDLGKFKYFTLGNPPRLVVDIYGVHPGFKERSFKADDGFTTVRVGTYSDKTRVVFDAGENVLPELQVAGRTSDVLVTWSAAASAADSTAAAASEPDAISTPAAASEPAVQPEPPVAEAKPVAEPAPAAAPAPAPVVVAAAEPAMAKAPVKKMAAANVESIDFSNEQGRSIIEVALSTESEITEPVEEGNLVRFEIVNAKISRALRRTIDSFAFPSAIASVTPYSVKDGDHQNVRIAAELKGPVAYALEKDGAKVRLVVDDGAYAEPLPPAVSQVEVVVPAAAPTDGGYTAVQMPEAAKAPRTADEMAVEAARYTGEKITLVFDSANVRSILQLIGDVSGLNILASSDVQGSVTLRLIDVPWDQALDLVLETANLGKIQQGNVLRIMPKERIREIEQANMKQQMLDIEEGVLEARTFSISYASVDDMKNYLSDIKSDRGSIIADSRNKQLIVRDVAAVLQQMQDMIVQIDKPERQVMIEARVVEANTNFSRQLGVKWNFDYENNGDSSNGLNEIRTGLGGSFLVPVTNPAAAGFGSSIAIGALNDQLNIDLRLSALETSGEGKIVSTPRITTLNGEKATISQGTKIPYSSVSDAGTDVQFENAELKLDVTPEINPDGSIQLDINVSNSAVGLIVPTATGDAVSIDEKKAQTKVLVQDGQTTVIGGIFIEDERDAQTGVPFLMSIPVFGHLFKSTTKTRDRRELLIFITPRIVES
ncbi:MAG: type IV pilus secretin PilQ [Desulfuromonadales bacterium]